MNNLQSVVLTLSHQLRADRRAAADRPGLCAPALVGQGGRRGGDERVLHCELCRRARIAGLGQRRQAARQPSSCCRPVSSSRIRWRAIRARSISGSRRSTTAIGRAASPGRTAFPTATGSRKRPTRRRARSPPAARRAVAPPILAMAAAACSRPPGNTSRPSMILDTSGGDPSTGGGLLAAPRAGDEVSFTPLLPPRMPPKDCSNRLSGMGRTWPSPEQSRIID